MTNTARSSGPRRIFRFPSKVPEAFEALLPDPTLDYRSLFSVLLWSLNFSYI